MKIGELSVGTTAEFCEKILRFPDKKTPFQEEYKIYADFGYQPEDFKVFQMGFDEVWEYYDFPNGYPVFKLYFKNNTLIFLILTSYTRDKSNENDALILRNFSLPNGVRFFDNISRVKIIMGEPEKTESQRNNDYTLLFYEKQGIILTFDNTEKELLRTMDIF